MSDERDREERLAWLLAAVHADADPALWTRVRARALARPPVPPLLAWAMRPVALAASFALFLGTAALAFTIAAGPVPAGEDYATLGDALLAERDAEAAAAPAAAPGGAARDSGSLR